MSAVPPKADMAKRDLHVRSVPTPDLQIPVRCGARVTVKDGVASYIEQLFLGGQI